MKKLFVFIMLTILLAACRKELSTAPEPEAPVGTASPVPEKACSDSASFVKDVTIPDNAELGPGEKFTKTWRVKNTGDCTWDDSYSLAFALSTRMDAPDSVPLKDTLPGQTVDISVELTAPDSEGSFRGDFLILDPDGDAVPLDGGRYLWAIIDVIVP